MQSISFKNLTVMQKILQLCPSSVTKMCSTGFTINLITSSNSLYYFSMCSSVLCAKHTYMVCIFHYYTVPIHLLLHFLIYMNKFNLRWVSQLLITTSISAKTHSSVNIMKDVCVKSVCMKITPPPPHTVRYTCY